jgi:hypothetical protein
MKAGRLARISVKVFLLLALGFLGGYLLNRWSEGRNAGAQVRTMPAACEGCPSANSCDRPECAPTLEAAEIEGKAVDAR